MMKKNGFIYLAIGAIAIFAMTRLNRCGGAQTVGGKVLVTKVTKEQTTVPGEWEEPEVGQPDDDDGPTFNPEAGTDVASLQKERDHYFGRYRYYKQTAHQLLESIRERDEQVVKALECSQKTRLQESQIEAMWNQRHRDSALIEQLFSQWEEASRQREYSGEVSGDLYTTQWRAKVFGRLPDDGLSIKTDVTQITTTIQKPVELWHPNTVEAFGGVNADANFLFGIGYEWRPFKPFGLFGQGEFIPATKDAILRGGARAHF